MNPLRLRLEWLLLLVLAFAGAVAGHSSGAIMRFDNRILDLATTLARPPADPDIFLVEIDDRALAEIGAWPWSRATHARLVDRLDAAGASLIVLDILFVEPTDQADDTALANAIARSGKVILAEGFGLVPDTLAEVAPVPPLAELQGPALGVGHVAAEPDEDGVLRRFALSEQIHGTTVPHLAVATLDALGRPIPSPPLRLGRAGNRPQIAFHSPGSFPAISAADVIAGRLPQGMIDGKIVFVGATAGGLGDRYAVAAGAIELMAGVETQANLVNALLAGKLVYPYRAVVHAVVAALSLMALFLAFWALPPRYGLLCALGMLVGLFALSILLVPLAGRWLAPGSLALAVLLAYPLWSWRRLTAVSSYLDREARYLDAEGSADDAEGVDFIARQVSRMRRLVHNVQDSLSFLRQVIEAAPDAILVLGRNGGVAMMNARAQAIFPGWTAATSPQFSDLLLDAHAALGDGSDEITTTDGKIFLVARAPLFATAPSRVDSGEIMVLREVTDLRRREEERKQMLEFLSHDMRTPQVAIIGLTRQGGASGIARATLGRIRSQAERTLRLADNFVQLARADEASPERADTDLAALVAEACDRNHAEAGLRGITLVQDLPAAPVFAEVDAAMIARMLDNLISNAIKFSPDGGQVTISLAEREDSWILIKVADKGPGLPPARMEEPFTRFGPRDERAGPSAGLGLAFVKQVVDSHGGLIEVESSSGQGSCFTIALPPGWPAE